MLKVWSRDKGLRKGKERKKDPKAPNNERKEKNLEPQARKREIVSWNGGKVIRSREKERKSNNKTLLVKKQMGG